MLLGGRKRPWEHGASVRYAGAYYEDDVSSSGTFDVHEHIHHQAYRSTHEKIGVVHGDVLVKTDQEPAIMAIIEEAGRVRAAEGGGRYVIEQSPVGSSASNGIVERAILGVEQQARVL